MISALFVGREKEFELAKRLLDLQLGGRGSIDGEVDAQYIITPAHNHTSEKTRNTATRTL